MSKVLVDLCDLEHLPDELSDKLRKRLYAVLCGIRNDTERHNQVALEILAKAERVTSA